MTEPDVRTSHLEREKTDESLRTERKNADHERIQKRTDDQLEADGVVERAREHADAVLETARGKADHMLGIQGRNALTKSRAREDEVLHDERAAADEILRREREEQARTRAALLPLEYETTDRFLLTERVRSDSALASRDDFLGMVSHDLRNLLSGIFLNATQLAEDASATDEGRRTIEGMERIQRYVARMNRLIGDLVDVVSIDAGKLAIQVARCDVTVLLNEAMDAFGYAAAAKGISLKSDTLETGLLADFDHGRMMQVLANLITNALKFTPASGTIAVRCNREGALLHLSVTDTGQGIPDTMLDAVFERFSQVGKNDQRGLGLGLYISKCIVTAHGGRIWAQSTLGAGSTFHFTIPSAPRPPPAP